MYAFVASLGNLLKLNTEKDIPNNFNQNKRRMVIPLYQREYKWPDEKICGLINDINSRDKFLGNIIMDELDDHYEIADGQQRITTCLLTLICLFNHFQGSPLEQESVRQYIMPVNGNPVLKNDSIGDFIYENEGALSISINDMQDCYCQKNDFIRAYNIIESLINRISDKGEISTFKRKFLDCEFLVLVNDRHTNSNPIEQVFLDINEKAKLLDPEDIFKGHCFEKYSEEFYQKLRDNWIELKKVAIVFKNFGFKDLSEYLYLFILETQNTDIVNNITKDLTIAGRHFLDNKTMDQIEALLQEMIQFGKAASVLRDNIEKDTYRFTDICPDSERFKDTGDHLVLKRMFSGMLLFSDAIYQKLPVLYFIYKLTTDEELRLTLTHDAFKRIITNLYIYNYVFAFFSNQKKSKKLIDHSLRDVLGSPTRSISAIIKATKDLRNAEIENAVLKDCNRKSMLFFVDSVLDYYVAQDNWLKDIYYDSSLCRFNLEHLVIPDDRRRRITWIGSDQSFDIVLSKDLVTKYKKVQSNFVVLDRELNRQIGRKDIVHKISEITNWYAAHSQPVPNHIQLYINHVKSCGKYNELAALKENAATQDVVKHIYYEFLNEYFSEENQNVLCQLVQQEFKNAFKNGQ